MIILRTTQYIEERYGQTMSDDTMCYIVAMGTKRAWFHEGTRPAKKIIYDRLDKETWTEKEIEEVSPNMWEEICS